MKLKNLTVCLLCLSIVCFACRLSALLAVSLLCLPFSEFFWNYSENFLKIFWKFFRKILKKKFFKKIFFQKKFEKILKKIFFIFIVLIFKIRAQFIKVQKWPKKIFLVKNIKMMSMVPLSAVEGCNSFPSVQMEIPPPSDDFTHFCFEIERAKMISNFSPISSIQ